MISKSTDALHIKNSTMLNGRVYSASNRESYHDIASSVFELGESEQLEDEFIQASKVMPLVLFDKNFTCRAARCTSIPRA